VTMMHQAKPRILIVDDDEAICKTFSAILQSEGYQTETAITAKESVEKAKAQFFNLALLDVKLPDMEGTQLLSKLQEITPETIKIIVTGYPSLKNAVDALNFGADSYIMKPIDPAELLKTIKSRLESQQQKEKISKEKLARWIQAQARKTKSSGFHEFLEQTSGELAEFGLTRTQAKIYIALLALGVASASEIASLSKIRREEVYRLVPELESHGLITRKLKTPRKFSANQAEAALQVLVKSKLEAMKEEIEKLEQKQDELIPKLKTIELPTKQEDCSIEVITQQDNAMIRLMSMTHKVKREIKLVCSLNELKYAYLNRSQNLREKILKAVRMQIVIDKLEVDALVEEIIHLSEESRNPIELRQVDELPFNLLIIDDKEAMWGGNPRGGGISADFWTDDPSQVSILRMSFENLWQKSNVVV